MNTLQEHKRRVQFVVKLKAIENAMGFSLLLFFQLPLLTSDLLTDQEVTRSKEVTLSGGNELADLVGSSPVGLRVVAFEEVSWIRRLYKNEVGGYVPHHVTGHVPTSLQLPPLGIAGSDSCRWKVVEKTSVRKNLTSGINEKKPPKP